MSENAIKPTSGQAWSWQRWTIARISGNYSPVDIYQCKTSMQSFVLTNQFKCNYLFVISHYVWSIQCNWKCHSWGTSPVNVKSSIIISSHDDCLCSWYECIFFPTYFKFLILYYVSVQYYRFSRRENAIPWNLFYRTQSFVSPLLQSKSINFSSFESTSPSVVW